MTGSQVSVKQMTRGEFAGSFNLRPHIQGQVFAFRQDQAAEENERVIAVTSILCGIPAYVLIDTSASHSFISARFVKRHQLPYVSLYVML